MQIQRCTRYIHSDKCTQSNLGALSPQYPCLNEKLLYFEKGFIDLPFQMYATRSKYSVEFCCFYPFFRHFFVNYVTWYDKYSTSKMILFNKIAKLTEVSFIGHGSLLKRKTKKYFFRNSFDWYGSYRIERNSF